MANTCGFRAARFPATSKYAKLAKCSQDTALRDILPLVERGILVRNPEGGRSTSYGLAMVTQSRVHNKMKEQEMTEGVHQQLRKRIGSWRQRGDPHARVATLLD